MNREIEINKFDNRISFINRGIGFSQVGVANEILNLIDDLQQENKQLKEENYKLQKCIYEEELDVQDQNRELGLRIDKAIEYIKENTDNTNFIEVPSKELLEILGGKENE